jgi:pSer/pThr/pTyr-binding forkhead associated (FHA) protein
MPITVIVRSKGVNDARVTFDGIESVVIGRGSSCDVRLPDPSVSHRHARVRAKGTDFVLVDEGSTNGTFVGQVRIAPRTSRIVRSGDMVRVGRIWLELRIDYGPVTREVAVATRDLALALVSQALAQGGMALTARIRVVEGADQGSSLTLADEGRAYVIGRDAQCDLPLSDADASREHLRVVRQGAVVVVRDLGAKNGTWIGETRAPQNGDIVWRPSQVMQIARTVLALEEPVADALARIEMAPDESLPTDEPIVPPERSTSPVASTAIPSDDSAHDLSRQPAATAPIAPTPPQGVALSAQPHRARFSIADILVVATAIGVLALSIAGLFWLLRG